MAVGALTIPFEKESLEYRIKFLAESLPIEE